MARHKSRKSRQKKFLHWLLAGLLLTPLLWFVYIEAGRAISYLTMRQIARLTNTNILTGSIEFQTDGSASIEKLVMSPKGRKGRDTILKAETVHAKFSPVSLLLLRPKLEVMDVENFVFNARYDLDTGWSNLAGAKIPSPKGHLDQMPRIELKNGTLQYSKISNGQSQVAVSVPINASFGLVKDSNEGYKFEIATAAMSSGLSKNRLAGSWRPGIVTVAGGISSIDVPELEMAWFVDVLAAEFKYDQDNNFTLKLSMPDLQSRRNAALERLASVGPAFLGKTGLFTALQGFLDQYQPQGLVDIGLEVSGNMSRLSQCEMAGKVQCKDVTFGYVKFPYTIEHLTGQIDFTKNSVKLNNLCGRHGNTNFFFNGWAKDFGADRKYQIRITSDNMPLDDDLYEALNAKQKRFWAAFSPAGHAGVDLRLSQQSKTNEEIRLDLELDDVEAVYRHFPYRLTNLTGKLSFNRNNVVFSNIISRIDERKVIVNGVIENGDIDKPMIYDFMIKVNNIPLDAKLQAALTDKQKDLYKELAPVGLADGWIKLSRQDSSPAGFTADLSFKDTSLKLDQFPLPVSDITAKAIFTPRWIIIKEFSGKYCNDPVSLSGQIHLNQEYQQSSYQLMLTLENTLLSDDLSGLMSGSVRKIVSELNPEGGVNLTVNLDKQSLAKPPDYSVTLECLGNSVTIPKLPYPLRNITGALTIKDNRIKLKDITATTDGNDPTMPEPPMINLNGEIILADDTYDSAILKLSAKNLAFDDQFALALPKEARPLYGKLSPGGRFDLDFDNIRFYHTDDGNKSIDFKGTVNLKNSSIEMSGATIELNAPLKTKGTYKTGEGLCSCRSELHGANLRILGKSLTNLEADIFYDPDSNDWSAQDFVADFYGGKFKGKFEFKQPAGQSEQYVLQSGFENVDLKQFLADTASGQAPEKGHTSGKMTGSLSLNSGLGDNSSRIGSCRLSISNMQVGKLSPLAKVLQVLQLSGPEDYAFDRMYVDSYIQRNNLFVRKLDLSGDSIAFYGSGSMDMPSRNVSMSLTSRGKRVATADPSLLQSLTEGLGQAVVRMDVTGDLYDLKVKTKTLPVLEQTLRIFGSKPETQN
jgi:hypothetical protein